MLGFESADAFKAYVTCLMLGISLLFAYNALLSTPAYFKDYYKFAQDDPNATTANPSFWNNVVSTISLVSNIPNLFAQAGLLHPASRKLKQHTKLIMGLSLMSVTLIMIPMVSVFKVSDSGSSAYLMSFIVLCALGTGLYQSTALALVAGFPPNFVGVCIVGIGISGIISNVIGIITQAAMPDTYDGHNNQSKIFYGISGAVIVVTLIALSFFKYNPYAQQYVPEYREAAAARNEEARRLLAGEDGGEDGGGLGSSDGAAINAKKHADTASSCSMATDGAVASPTEGEEAAGDSQAMLAEASTMAIFKLTWPMQLSVFVTFTITLFIMPSLAVAVDPDATWYPVLVITTFNVCDTIGRYIPNIKATWMPRKALVAFSMGRLAIIPMWFLTYKTNVIPGLVYPMVLMGVTGITNGYAGCMSMVYAPLSEGVDNEARKNVSGNIVSFMLLLGCSVGSVIGWLVTTYS